MAGLDDVAKIDINTTLHDEEKTKRLISMAKRRRSSAASNPPTPLSIKRPPTKKKHLNPSIEIEKAVHPQKEFKFSTLRDLALYTLQVGDNCPKYIKVKNRAQINNVVLVTTPGLDALTHFGATDIPPSTDNITEGLPVLKENFQEFVRLTAPGDRESVYPLMKSLSMRPFTKSEKSRITKELKDKKLVLPDLKMTLEEMTLNGYPIHPMTDAVIAGETPEGWIDTKKFAHDGSHTFALDCEMCETASGKTLTRISVIDFDETVIMDEYVKPAEEITDYLTQYSGITREILEGVTTTLEDIQRKLLEIISTDDFLIGHSLENDLKVMRLRHPNIIDTSVVFEHPRGPPFKSSLKYLTRVYLQRSIQNGEHDSIEDSKACLDLVKLKLVEGGLLGKVVDGQSVFEDLMKLEKKAVFIDRTRVQPNQERYIQCANEDDIVDTIIKKVPTHHLVIGNLRSDKESLSELNSRLEKILSALPPKTIFIVASGSGEQTEMRKLALEKKAHPELWTTEDEEKLREITRTTRLGVGFFKII
ncbi:CYFA0S08e00188g1_1 [Cyberlindnera fabianii]|uniref:CYFA0S08e00188g1_1 n=1 Tax=Cyberlindnera fabianii TaxID=36022 RepID=A0A061AVX1_CYBFA|nr:RNA exonuclease 1 [Cyberlindnera fabianii]CDR41802.1 CYFA0S08e00188g1_1 [Cyberlindnera fabianii]